MAASRDPRPSRRPTRRCRVPSTADDAVRLCIDAQLRARVDVLTDGEQRRDSYASFAGGSWTTVSWYHSPIGVGVVNQKLDSVEPIEDIASRVAHAVDLFGKERVLLTPDCGFATFADNPVASAEAKLKAIAEARDLIVSTSGDPGSLADAASPSPEYSSLLPERAPSQWPMPQP